MVELIVQRKGETDKQLYARMEAETLAKNAAKKKAEEASRAKILATGTVNVMIPDNPKIDVSMSVDEANQSNEKKIRAKEYYSVVDEYIDLLINE